MPERQRATKLTVCVKFAASYARLKLLATTRRLNCVPVRPNPPLGAHGRLCVIECDAEKANMDGKMIAAE
jgi:hypothetical protein